MMKYIKVEGKSDIGLKRQENEDSFLAITEENYTLAVVADGMGGHRGGKDASSIAVKTIKEHVRSGIGKKKPEQIIEEAFIQADKNIKEASVEKYGCQEMATTCSLVLAIAPELTVEEEVLADIYVGHVGDSRIYRVRNSEIERLSTDHTLMQSMKDSGAFEDGTVKEDLPYGHLVYKSLGGNTLEMDPVKRFRFRKGDSIILCSDGVSRYLEDNEILGIALKNIDNSSYVEDFIDISNERGGEDNITAVSMKSADFSSSAGYEQEELFPVTESRYLFSLKIEKSAAMFATLFLIILFIVSIWGALDS